MNRSPDSEGNTDMSERLLALMADRAVQHEPDRYVIGLLHLYMQWQRSSEADVAGFLGISMGRAWMRLGLCGWPRSERGVFWSDVRSIAARAGADPDRLVTVVRMVDTLETVHSLPSDTGLVQVGGTLAAARDRDVSSGVTNTREAPASQEATVEPVRVLPLWLDAGTQEVVEQFWQAAGASEPEPEHLERDALRSLPCSVVYLDRLTLSGIEAWLRERNVHYRFPCADRFLHGCLLAYRGCGLIFIDEEDSPEERRYTLAHEIVHFLLDYLEPREEAISRLGPDAAEVLDGSRHPTLSESLEAVFQRVSLQSYFHLMDRSGGDRRGSAVSTGPTQMSDLVLAAEELADRVALELLAPVRTVMTQLADSGIVASTRDVSLFVAAARDHLAKEYSIPSGPAVAYASTLAGAFPGEMTVKDWLAEL